MRLKINILLLTLLLAFLPSCVKKRAKENIEHTVTVNVEQIGSNTTSGQLYPGSIVARVDATIFPPYSGRLDSLYVREGQSVKKGDVLAKIYSQQILSLYQTAAATLRQAQDGYDRLTKVHQTNSVPEVKLIEIESDLERAKASEQSAKHALEELVIKAPFSGVVQGVEVGVGKEVSLTEPIMRIVDTSTLEIEISVSETKISSIKKGDKATIIIPALDNLSFNSVVKSKSVTGSSFSHTYTCVLECAKNSNISAGMVCKVILNNKDEQQILTIPASVIRFDDQGRYIWVAKPSNSEYIVEKRHITIGNFIGNKVEIASGVVAGEYCIVEGFEKVSSNMKVDINIR